MSGHWIGFIIAKTIMWVVVPGAVLLVAFIASTATDAIEEAREQEALERQKAAALAAESDDAPRP